MSKSKVNLDEMNYKYRFLTKKNYKNLLSSFKLSKCYKCLQNASEKLFQVATVFKSPRWLAIEQVLCSRYAQHTITAYAKEVLTTHRPIVL